MGKIFCVEFQRVPLKFHIKKAYSYIERYDFMQMKISLKDILRALISKIDKHFLNICW